MSPREPAFRRRLAALFAIACLGGALVAVGFAVVRGDAWRLPLVLAAGVVVVVGLWYVLSSRGTTRILGAVSAAIGVATGLLVTFTGDYRGVPLLLSAALILASAAAARYALRRDDRTKQAAAPTSIRPRPNHPVLIMNPRSGGGKVERFRLVDECRARGIEPIVLGAGDDLAQVAADALAGGTDTIGMAGGDGSQALVAGLASQQGVPHVCIPAGTRNHFALDLGLDRNDVVGALDAFSNGVERRVDLARVNGRVFVNNACMGLYARIVQSDTYRQAHLRTAADMLPDMLGPGTTPFDLRFSEPDGTEYSTAHLVLVSNNPYQLDHLMGRGTRTRMDLGTLGVAAAWIQGAAAAVQFVGLEATGRIRSFPGWLEWDTPDLRVDSGAPIEIAIDGEALTMDPPLVFESMPGALRVRLPKHAPGVAASSRPRELTAGTISDLIKIAAGKRRPGE